MEIVIIGFVILFLASWVWPWVQWRKELKRRHKIELELMYCRGQLLEFRKEEG